ncbi:uncharacterized protein LOC113765708 [Coffea eugenioides]|uniref:uncharacterized protein LOC113765708 n=1 Tax=Coffea eugenioides TaxID=49369 RepID=UPI000F611EF6|nr:uncharacterized protein LOC113765708 [Coffea eugenioides]
MANSLLTQAAPATTAIPISTRSKQSNATQSSLSFPRVSAFHRGSDQAPCPNLLYRRSLAFGLVGAVLGLNTAEKNASGAARRPPPPPPEEKKDPNVSGLTAKVLASKRRKEAMKENVAKLRKQGKPIITEPSE